MEDQYVNRVETYIRGDMTEREAKQFEEELETNSVLADVYREYTLATEAVDQQVEMDLKDQFEAWEREEDKRPKGVVIPLFMKIAASLIILVGVSYLIFHKSKTLTGEQLALKEYKLPESQGSTMGEGNELWSVGLWAYENKDYAEAIKNWSELENPNPEMLYYLAHAYFNTGQYDNALSLFKELSNGTSTYNYSSDWYLLLTYLAADHKEEFDQLVAKISDDPNHPYQKDAIELKERVDK